MTKGDTVSRSPEWAWAQSAIEYRYEDRGHAPARRSTARRAPIPKVSSTKVVLQASMEHMQPPSSYTPEAPARPHRSVVIGVVAGIVVAIVAVGCVGRSSFTDAGTPPANSATLSEVSPPSSESTHPSIPPMRNGSIDVFGTLDGVRLLTPRGNGKSIFECTGPCPEVGGADWSPDGTLLAFASDHPRGGTYDGLHVVDPARGTDRLLAPGSLIYEPAWSPDGTRIAYVDLQQIFVVNEDGSGRTAVVTINGNAYPSHPSWSPDGSRIVYSAGGWLYVVGLDGSAPSPLVMGFSPTWSPDGNMIAYVGGGDIRSPSGCEIRETTPDGRHDSSLVDLATVGPGPKTCSGRAISNGLQTARGSRRQSSGSPLQGVACSSRCSS